MPDVQQSILFPNGFLSNVSSLTILTLELFSMFEFGSVGCSFQSSRHNRRFATTNKTSEKAWKNSTSHHEKTKNFHSLLLLCVEKKMASTLVHDKMFPQDFLDVQKMGNRISFLPLTHLKNIFFFPHGL